MTPADIMRFREKHRLTCQELAQLIGVHKSQVTRWETKGQKIPAWLSQFFKLIEATGKPITEIRQILCPLSH